MKYLVVLDESSAIGGICAAGENDGFVHAGALRHPVLECAEIATEDPGYLFVKRDRSRQHQPHQCLHIPHSSVVMIHHFSDADWSSFGFVRPTE